MSGTLLLELGAVVLVLALLARLGVRLGVSVIPLYLAAGLIIGEGGPLAIVESRQFIETGAEIGVILLLFMLGLEYSAGELVSGLRISVPSGAFDLVANFLPGLAAGLLLGWGGTAAIALGGVTYISSSGIAAKLLADLGWLGNRETPKVLSLLVIEDLVMAVYLPVLGVLLVGDDLLEGAVTTTVVLMGVAVVFLLALRFGERLSGFVFARSDEATLLTILGVTLLVGGIAEEAQISAAVGAFFVGLAVSGETAESSRALLTPLRDLFAAVFFVFFGFEIDPGAFGPVLVPALTLAVVTGATKYATAWYAGSRVGLGRRGRLRAGALLVARGEFSIVIAGLAIASGLEPDLGALAAAYVMTMTAVGPLLARFADRPSRPATTAGTG